MKVNQKGFAHLGLILIVVVVLGVTGFAGYRIVTKDKKNNSEISQSANGGAKKEETSSQNLATTATPQADPTKDWTLVAPKNTDNTFTVKVPKSLLPEGTCKTKEVLLAIIYNSDSFDYDCSGVKDALRYASIVFGASSQSVVSTFGTAQSSDKVTLADGKTTAIKSIVTGQVKAHGENYTALYVIYEATSKKTGSNYYAVYKAGVGFSNEDKFLKDYEAAVTKGWTLP
jgi:Tfp pilus assembly protein PilX